MPRKLLPKPDKSNTLSRFGYSLSHKSTSRHNSLKSASKKYGTLPVLKRLNLIRNLTVPEKNKKKLSQDVDYIKRVYAREKSRRQKSRK
jgi:hypothetical protein